MIKDPSLNIHKKAFNKKFVLRTFYYATVHGRGSKVLKLLVKIPMMAYLISKNINLHIMAYLISNNINIHNITYLISSPKNN